MFLLQSLPFKTDGESSVEPFGDSNRSIWYCVRLGDLRRFYIPPKLYNLDTGVSIYPFSMYDFFDIVCSDKIIGMTFFERDLVFVIDSDAKFLFMTDKSEGLLPLIEGDRGETVVWSPSLPDLLGRYSPEILDKILMSGYTLLRPDVQCPKAALLYGVNIVVYQGSLLYISTSHDTLDRIPLYRMCTSISMVCHFGWESLSDSCIWLELDDQLLKSLMTYVLCKDVVVPWTCYKFALTHCSQDTIVSFVMTIYTEMLKIPGVPYNNGNNLSTEHLDEIYASYAEVAELFRGTCASLSIQGVELYRSLSDTSRRKYFSLADDLMLTEIETIEELVSKPGKEFFYEVQDLENFQFSLKLYLDSATHLEEVAVLFEVLSKYIHSASGKAYIDRLETLLYILRLEYMCFKNIPEVVSDYVTSHMVALCRHLRSCRDKLVADSHRRYHIDL